MSGTPSGKERRAQRSQTLDDLLVEPNLSLRKLRDHFLQLQAPLVSSEALRAHMTGSNVAPSTDHVASARARLAMISTCLALVDEIGTRSRKSEPSTSISKETDAPLVTEDGQYALHMRLPGGDYFTNAVWMSEKEAKALDPANAQLVGVSNGLVARWSGAVPSLGERLHPNRSKYSSLHHAQRKIKNKSRKRDDGDFAKPVSHLYYGPWTSFAPTYDSFDAQLSYESSCALWRSKRDEKDELDAWTDPSTSLGDPKRIQIEDGLAAFEDDLDVDAIMEAYDEMPQAAGAENDLDDVLRENVVLICRLQALQEQRIRKLVALDIVSKDAKRPPADAPSSTEKAVARRLVDSLAKLLSMRPRHQNDGVIPTVKKLQALSSSVAADPALLDGHAEPGAWGTLEEAYYGTKRQSSGRHAVKVPAAIRDNETMRLPNDAEDKASSQVAAITRSNHDRGVGLLERFASSRSYSFVDHPHDKKPSHHASTKPSTSAQPHAHRAGPASSPQANRTPSSSSRQTFSTRPPYPAGTQSFARPPQSFHPSTHNSMSYNRPLTGPAPPTHARPMWQGMQPNASPKYYAPTANPRPPMYNYRPPR